MVDMCHYTFIKIYRMYTKSESQGKWWVWMIMIYQSGFISCSKSTTAVWDVDSGEIIHVQGEWVYDNFYPQFCCEPKTSLKRNFIN